MIKIAFLILITLVVLALAALFFLGRISRTGEAPGLVQGRLAPCPETPNCVSSDADKNSEHFVEPLVFDPEAIFPLDAWKRIQEVIGDFPGTRITEVTDDYLSAECKSAVIGFVDDLELHFRPESSTIAIRSASRVGRSDFEANRKRVEDLRVRFQNDPPR